ncbi:MAG TPA: DMT family transporter [Bacteroidales bacterium]|nr:DMT family transporter [Bacteroidales bacterium]HPI86625.1 DMT family transporter [Bacteroidales bacterium]HPM92244.1 DMT family transporter [Bacteroidales bacterium]
MTSTINARQELNRTFKTHIALLGANFIYGLNYVIAKGIMPDHLSPKSIIFIRVIITVVIFWILHLFIPSEKVEKRDLFKFALCAFFGVAVNQLLFFEGLNLSTPINASIIITVIPVLVLLFSHFILHDKITPIKVAGIIMGAAGALMVILSAGAGDFRSATMLGNLLIFINAASWSFYLVLIKPLMERYDNFTVMKWVFLFGFIIIFPFTFNSFASSSFSTIPVNIWLSISFVVFGATIIAYFLNNYSLKSVSPSVNGIYIYLQPLIASVVSILFGKDQISVIKILAAILIMTGVYLVTRHSRKTASIFPEQ